MKQKLNLQWQTSIFCMACVLPLIALPLKLNASSTLEKVFCASLFSSKNPSDQPTIHQVKILRSRETTEVVQRILSDRWDEAPNYQVLFNIISEFIYHDTLLSKNEVDLRTFLEELVKHRPFLDLGLGAVTNRLRITFQTWPSTDSLRLNFDSEVESRGHRLQNLLLKIIKDNKLYSPIEAELVAEDWVISRNEREPFNRLGLVEIPQSPMGAEIKFKDVPISNSERPGFGADSWGSIIQYLLINSENPKILELPSGLNSRNSHLPRYLDYFRSPRVFSYRDGDNLLLVTIDDNQVISLWGAKVTGPSEWGLIAAIAPAMVGYESRTYAGYQAKYNYIHLDHIRIGRAANGAYTLIAYSPETNLNFPPRWKAYQLKFFNRRTEDAIEPRSREGLRILAFNGDPQYFGKLDYTDTSRANSEIELKSIPADTLADLGYSPQFGPVAIARDGILVYVGRKETVDNGLASRFIFLRRSDEPLPYKVFGLENFQGFARDQNNQIVGAIKEPKYDKITTIPLFDDVTVDPYSPLLVDIERGFGALKVKPQPQQYKEIATVFVEDFKEQPLVRTLSPKKLLDTQFNLKQASNYVAVSGGRFEIAVGFPKENGLNLKQFIAYIFVRRIGENQPTRILIVGTRHSFLTNREGEIIGVRTKDGFGAELIKFDPLTTDDELMASNQRKVSDVINKETLTAEQARKVIFRVEGGERRIIDQSEAASLLGKNPYFKSIDPKRRYILYVMVRDEKAKVTYIGFRFSGEAFPYKVIKLAGLYHDRIVNDWERNRIVISSDVSQLTVSYEDF